MARFLVRRISLIGVTLLVVSFAIFAITEILPGDTATFFFGQGATEQNLKNYREELGLDRAWYVRYADWIDGVPFGDLGDSFVQKRPVTEVIKPRLINSLYLALFAFVFAIPSAVVVGVWSGIRHHSWATTPSAWRASSPSPCPSSSPESCSSSCSRRFSESCRRRA